MLLGAALTVWSRCKSLPLPSGSLHRELCIERGWRLGAQVLATDGVWEVMDCDNVARFVGAWRERPWPGWNASDALSLEAQERWKLLQPEVGHALGLHILTAASQPVATAVGGVASGTSCWFGYCWLRKGPVHQPLVQGAGVDLSMCCCNVDFIGHAACARR